LIFRKKRRLACLVNTIFGFGTMKKFKKLLLGQETLPNEDEDLDENSSDAETRKKLKARTANEKAYCVFTLRIITIQKQLNYQVEVHPLSG
jgi:hypothetical protein